MGLNRVRFLVMLQVSADRSAIVMANSTEKQGTPGHKSTGNEAELIFLGWLKILAFSAAEPGERMRE